MDVLVSCHFLSRFACNERRLGRVCICSVAMVSRFFSLDKPRIDFKLPPHSLSLRVIDRIDACTDVAISTLRPFIAASSPTARFWAPREMLTLRTWSRNVPLASSSSSSSSLSSSSSAGGSSHATATAASESKAAAAAAAAAPSSACVLIEVGVAYKDRECAAGAVRAAVNFVGYVARAAPHDENQSACNSVCFFSVLCA